MAHSALVLDEWDCLMSIVRQWDESKGTVVVDGKSLDLAAVVAVAK